MRSGARFGVGLGLLLAALVAPGARPASALTITLDYSLDTNNFFGSAAARNALARAADYYEAFTDTLSAITPGGVNNWNANFTHPGTGAAHSLPNMSIAADEIIVFAGGRSFGGSTLGQGGPGGFSAGGTAAFLNAVVGRSQPGAFGPPASRTDFGPWGGSISFDTGTSWHFGLSTTGLDPGESDFLSVALHELGHLLGFGTADSWDNLVSGGSFTGANSVAAFGGNVPLDSANAHWANGTASGGQEAAMDPSITVGTRKLLTVLDYAGLEDIGWQVVLLPEPADAVLLAAAALAWLLTRRR